ncbi:MAG: hybrid sensor histidine kinase/response regulator, partial [Magnetococcales bacterium]|nr:hybrid sensor histidine kinase/response regulator [Magnetococcales bacterium]
ILIVDDERLNLKILSDLLRHDYATQVAKSGQQALARAKSSQPPDLILLDIVMPEMDGFTVCRRLKEDPETAAIPVIFITSKSEVADEARGLSLGAVDYISKPISAPVVRARIKTHLALQQQRRDLIALNEEKNRFLGMAAHDLRNPLSSIQGLGELLLEMDVENEDRTSFLSTIVQVSGQMLDLLNDLLDLSTIESGRFDLERSRCDLVEVLKERCRIAGFVAMSKSITIDLDLPEEAMLSVDVTRIGQVIDNLLSNAIKFSPAETRIDVSLQQSGDTLRFSVVDQGPGISEEEKERLFGAFETASAQPTGGEKSSGLGLSIVKQIVQAHTGEIIVENGPEAGAAFTVVLPVS